MEKEQISLLSALAEKLKKEKPSKDSALKSLHSAGIITKNGNFTKSFPNLERILSISK